MVWGSEDHDISRRQGFCTPRPERLPEGEAQGQSQGPRGAKFLHEGNLKVEEVCVVFFVGVSSGRKTLTLRSFLMRFTIL